MKVEHKAVTPMHNTHAHVGSGGIPLWDASWLLQITVTQRGWQSCIQSYLTPLERSPSSVESE